MTRSKIVLVPFPFDDFSQTKVRPALCLTEPIGEHRHVVVSFVSSKLPDTTLETDIIVNDTHSHFSETGLKVSSIIRLHRMITIPVSLFKRELGNIPVQIEEQVNTTLQKLFHLV